MTNGINTTSVAIHTKSVIDADAFSLLGARVIVKEFHPNRECIGSRQLINLNNAIEIVDWTQISVDIETFRCTHANLIRLCRRQLHHIRRRIMLHTIQYRRHLIGSRVTPSGRHIGALRGMNRNIVRVFRQPQLFVLALPLIMLDLRIGNILAHHAQRHLHLHRYLVLKFLGCHNRGRLMLNKLARKCHFQFLAVEFVQFLAPFRSFRIQTTFSHKCRQ
mmetsp:Transcript_16298/g.25036  ORF Transcript_16298/g.25036 Transcript_16298/m.25036 type:complete len:219 (+) Transcript_16298:1137-1793(+)